MAKTNKKSSKSKQRRPTADELALNGRMPNQRVFRTQRVFELTFTQPVSDTGSFLQHALTDMPQVTDMTNAFQEYRIVGVEVCFSMVGHNAQPVFPTLYLAEDKADIVVPTSLANISAVSNLVIHDFSPTKNQYKRLYQPAPQIGAWQGSGLVTGYALDTNKRWISTQYPNVVYFGMKYWLTNYNSSLAGLVMKYRARYIIELRGFK